MVYNGDPLAPADPTASREHPNTLLCRQVGHSIAPVPGLTRVTVEIELEDWPAPEGYYAQVCALDMGATGSHDTAVLPPVLAVGD